MTDTTGRWPPGEYKATDAPKQTPKERAAWNEHVRELWTVGQRTSLRCCERGG